MQMKEQIKVDETGRIMTAFVGDDSTRPLWARHLAVILHGGFL